MRVAINAAVISHPLTGVARYAFELGHALSDIGTSVEYWTWDRFYDALRNKVGKEQTIRSFPHLKGIGTALIPGIRSLASRLDIYHFPNGDLLKCPVPRTAMVHDLAPFIFDDILPSDIRDFYREKTRRVVRLCAAVMVNSRTTLDDLLELFPEGAARYHLTPLGCDHELPAAGDSSQLPAGVTPGYLLSVGTVEPRKNYDTLIRAYGILAGSAGGNDVPLLVIAGGEGYRAEETKALPGNLGIGDRILFTGYVDEQTLSTLYANAAAYVHSSVYEGFGLPLVEAMRRNLPIAAADNSSVRELFTGLYLPFDAGSDESAASAIAKVLSGSLDDGVSIRRREVLKNMTWENCAMETVRAFNSVLGA